MGNDLSIHFNICSIYLFSRCFIPSSYAAFSVAVIPVLLLMLAVGVVFVQAYQVTAQWKYYDDIYLGRHNIKGKLKSICLKLLKQKCENKHFHAVVPRVQNEKLRYLMNINKCLWIYLLNIFKYQKLILYLIF